MSSEQFVVRAAPLSNNVAFVTRTSDDAPNASAARGAQVPGFGTEAEAALADQPCTLKGLSGGLAAGVLGFVFGFVPSMFRHRSLRMLHVWGGEGLASAKAFAVMSGIYTTVQCLCERIRQQDDGINRLIAGGASGVAIAWRSGLVGALQSGVLLAVVSWIFDFGSGSPAKASTLGCSSGACSGGVCRLVSCSQDTGADDAAERRRRAPLHLRLGGGAGWGAGVPDPVQVLRTPVVMWMGPIVNRAYFSQPALSVHA
ncbi:hypothetical protein PLESTB_000823300 [Pleodorina starrii]|uniref:Mitochondrial import inner membrane translocase subunit TIM22 n=1 Tax=Pleodorina starrii TaxID=330485 RepID=A0A9W6BMI9_9CHLO|nr:hypothetical protein PLESTM_000138800 [Pleodorina starrii]GLC54096.1 hypothetical protein PLESTB_000823300 [Pleodorina starrii]GLC64599.1 hypothetical protein PLESTF_000183100 [Pleodorina starrii]